jgi:predicted dehydrogenase/aryl-alcohol dehydrogenase-like predicted oxidoreductase
VKQTRWGIIGPGDIAHNFADGLKEAPSGRLVAIASRSADRRASFGDDYDIAPQKRHDDYAKLAADPDVDAIYIATPNVFHAEQSIMAMRAGKHVVCEKPAGMTAGQVLAMTQTAAQGGLFFMEGFMYRCHPQIARLVEIIRSGEIGDVRHIRAAFGFDSTFERSSRLYDRALGGGAILDVGVYPISLARLVAGAAIGEPFDNPQTLKGVGHLGASQVDEESYALLQFSSGITAQCMVAVRKEMDNSATIIGSKGEIHLPDPWVPGRNAGPSDAIIQVTTDGKTRTEEIKRPEHLFFYEAELASAAIAAGRQEPDPPAATWADSIGNSQTIDRWRHEVGYDYTPLDSTIASVLPGVMPGGLPQMPKRTIEGVAQPISALIMGCDNQPSLADGAIAWDAWLEAGGNAFDTAHVYDDGRHEAMLGQWIAQRGVANDIVVIAKGAHSPYCTPRTIASELTGSLDRLGLESTPVYIMHRDNPEVPAGEFVDALNREHQAGRIGIFGGSNWSVERFAEANAYAAEHGLQPMRILNNNLSLAVMERPLWDGCLTSNSPATLAYLEDHNVVHLSWSSQARGYFLPEELRNRLPEDTGPETCFGSADNAERRRRAEQLAKERGLSPHNIATAWVLAQPFPSFALIGPRSPGEITSTLPALTADLSPAEVAWLNLATVER